MAFQLGAILRSAMLNTINGTVGVGATMKIFSGPEPVNAAAPDPTGLLATITLPDTPFGIAANGVINLSGPWSGVGSAAGIAASFRIYDTGGNVHFQGNTSIDLVLSSTSVDIGKPITISVYQLTEGNS